MQLIFELAFLPSCCVLEKRMLIFNICFIHTHMLYWKVYIGRQTCFLVPLPHLCPASQVCHQAWYCCFCFYIHCGLRLSCHFSPSLVDWFRSISLFQVWYLAKKKKKKKKARVLLNFNLVMPFSKRKKRQQKTITLKQCSDLNNHTLKILLSGKSH